MQLLRDYTAARMFPGNIPNIFKTHFQQVISGRLRLIIFYGDKELDNESCSWKNKSLNAMQNLWKVLAARFISSKVAG